MRWVAPTAVTMFGTGYGAGAKVNVTSWTTEQLKAQIYLGNIVPDYTVGDTYSFIGEDLFSWDFPKTDAAMSSGAAGSFVAPPSGRVTIHTNIYGRARNVDGGMLRVNVIVATGSTLRAGTKISTSPSVTLPYHSSDLAMNSLGFVVTGLTPSGTYNAYHVFTNGTGGIQASYPRIIVVPIPE